MTNSNHPFQLPTRDLGHGDSATPREASSQSRHPRRPAKVPRGGYRVDDPSQFSMQNFAEAENLNRAYTQLIREGGPAAGLDGIRLRICRAESDGDSCE